MKLFNSGTFDFHFSSIKPRLEFFVLFIGFFLSSPLHAGSINLDFRGDAVSQSVNTEAREANSGRDHFKFFLNTARIEFRGDLNSQLYFRSRLKLTETATTKNQRDNLTNLVELAYISMKLSENLKFSAGKIGTDVGGIEGQTASPDLYLTSQVYQLLGTERYAAGLKMTMSFSKGSLSFLSVNQPTDVPAAATSGTYEQNRTMLGSVFKTQFSEFFQPQLGYFSTARQNGDSNRQDNLLNIGFRSAWSDLTFEYDFLLNEYVAKTSPKLTDSVQTHLASLSYIVDRWTPRLKVESSTEVTALSATSSQNQMIQYHGYQAALEYRPESDQNLRYHLAFIHREKSPEVTKMQVIQTVLIGARLNADFLK